MMARQRRTQVSRMSQLKNPYQKALLQVEKKINTSFKKLSSDLKRSANYKTILKDNQDISMLLGECNYLLRECNLALKPARGRKTMMSQRAMSQKAMSQRAMSQKRHYRSYR